MTGADTTAADADTVADGVDEAAELAAFLAAEAVANDYRTARRDDAAE